jgi:hypothetical protein
MAMAIAGGVTEPRETVTGRYGESRTKPIR